MIDNRFFLILLALTVIMLGAGGARKRLYKRKLQREQEERLRKMGEEGEETTAYFLYKVRGYKRILHHVYVPKADISQTTEIDLVMVHQKGIIVVENKNYSGSIYGREEDKYWTQVYDNGEKRSFYNPVKQNISHIRHLKAFLSSSIPTEVPYLSVITFNNRARLKRIWVDRETALVVSEKKVRRRLKKSLRGLPRALSRREVEEISQFLAETAGGSPKIRREHEKQVKNLVKKRTKFF